MSLRKCILSVLTIVMLAMPIGCTTASFTREPAAFRIGELPAQPPLTAAGAIERSRAPAQLVPATVRFQDETVAGEPTSVPARPNISEPGPDSADLSDSAFTVPPGVVFFETSLTYESSKGPRVRDYFSNTLVRIGIWDELELRIGTPGVIYQDGPDEATTGVGAFTFGFKRHIWDEEGLVPAFGVVGQVTAPTASAGFDDGTAVPTLLANFDHTLSDQWGFEWNVGISGAHDDDGDRFTQGIVLFSLGYDPIEDLTTFVHGQINFPAGSGDQEEVVIGSGLIWFVTERSALDFSYNFGVTEESPHRQVRLGLSLAF